MKTIGQFAKENDVTVKTLHYYEKVGLVTPTEVDPDSGYRYYDDSVKQELSIIVFLKELGFSLSEIKTVLNETIDKSRFQELIALKKKQTTNDKDSASIRLHKLGTILDVLDQKEHQHLRYKELLQMSKMELFSGAYGRGKFIEESERLFEQAQAEKQPLCVVQMDLDRFHQVNKKYGYDVGDIVLERTQDEIASILQEYPKTSILERRGGDEFSFIILENALATSKLITTILNRIVAVDYSDVVDDDFSVGITAGLAALTKRTKSYQSLVHKASMKLFEAKQRG